MVGKQDSPAASSHNPLRLSLRTRVTLAVLLPLILIFGMFMMMQYQLQRKMLMDNLTLMAAQTSLTIEHSLAEAMLNHNQRDLQEILDSIGQNKMIREIFLMDTAGKVIFSPQGRQVGDQLSFHEPTCQPCHSKPPEQRPLSVVTTLADGQRVFRSMNPIQNKTECHGCHDPSQRINGVLMTDISIAPMETSLKLDMWQHFLLWAAAVLVSVLVVNVVIDRFVLSGLEKLSLAIKEFGLGQQSARLPENQTDEIGQVSLAFNEMARKIELREVENQDLTEALQQQSQERGELLKRLITAQEDERLRLAREMHDELGQAMAVLALQTEVAHNSVKTKPEQAIQTLDQIQSLVGETTEQMYSMIMALRPSVLDDLGLAAALHSHAQRILANSNTAFHLDSACLDRRLPPELEIVMYRVFQEALTNISRYAQARNVTIRLARENGMFTGEIEDDGQGFELSAVRGRPDKTQGLGLLGMQERVLQQNGQLEIISRPGQGTRIIIRIPIQEDHHG